MNTAASPAYVHPVVAVAILVVGLLILLLPRKYVILAFVAASFLIPMDQVVLVGPFHFYTQRILVLFAWIRMLSIRLSSGVTIFSGGLNTIDKAVVSGTIIAAFNFVVLWGVDDGLVNQLGFLYTVFGIYLLTRFLIREPEDTERMITALAYVSALIAIIMFTEQATGHNPYAFIGGAREAVRQSLEDREGKFRAFGSFQHPILAGTFGAILLPLFVGLWNKSKKIAVMGVLASTVIVFETQSSTPISAYAAGIAALCLWPLRERLRWLRWGLVSGIVFLHFVMRAPVWALVARVDLTGSSSSYHRYMLVDQCIRHFSDWWLIGTKDYPRWGYDMWDLCNQYVAIADTTGLLPLILFIVVLVFAFKYIGRARRAAKYDGDKKAEFYRWALGASLFANIVAFLGISYWDQTMVAWYALLAMISAVYRSAVRAVQPTIPVLDPSEPLRAIGSAR